MSPLLSLPPLPPPPPSRPLSPQLLPPTSMPAGGPLRQLERHLPRAPGDLAPGAFSALAAPPLRWHARGGSGAVWSPPATTVATVSAAATAVAMASWALSFSPSVASLLRHEGRALPRPVTRRTLVTVRSATTVVMAVVHPKGSPSPQQQQRRAQLRPAAAAIHPPPAAMSLLSSAAPADATAADAAAEATAAAAAGPAATTTDGGPILGELAGSRALLTAPLPAELIATGEGSGSAALPAVDVTALRMSLARRRSIRRCGMAGSTAAAIVAYIFSPLPPPPAGVVAAVAAAATGWVLLGGTAEIGHDGCIYLHSPFAAGRRALGGSFAADRPVPFPPASSVTVRPTGDGRGWGVYAATALPAGTPLGEYEGETLDTASFFARYPPGGESRGDYVLALDADWVTDGAAAATAARAAGTYTPALMNHARAGAAVARVARRRARAVGFVTTRPVVAGEELCWDYGRAYWAGREEEEMP